MNKIIAFFFALFPLLAFADATSLSFMPPASDYSVVFLGNIFGIVDGVLHGNGSQIMGSIFSVFNSAVLALGGIFIIYTLMVSTLNTAHEGQMMGQKWSSMWIPVRSTVGLALLIPKASGYCMMQIFVMWIVLQGVGAADKVWDAALSYLNRGGVIIQAQQPDPGKAILAASSPSEGAEIPMMAQTILAGQVCMAALQKQITLQMNDCKASAASPDPHCPAYQNITSVPDFINTVNLITAQGTLSHNPPNYSVGMPNTKDAANFKDLDSVCGVLTWNMLPVNKMIQIIGTLPAQKSEMDAIVNTRAIALQQMYMDLSSIAQKIVTNDPQLGKVNSNAPKPDAPPIGTLSFGIVKNGTSTAATICTKPDSSCTVWTSLTNGSSPLFNGTEFQGAISDYNGVMLPTLTLMEQSDNSDSLTSGKEFISQASARGWIMAGSYFFNVLKLNINATRSIDSQGDNDNSSLTDSETGFKFSSAPPASTWVACETKKTPSKVCKYLPTNLFTIPDDNPAAGTYIQGLIDGTGIKSGVSPIAPPPLLGTQNLVGQDSDPYASTVYGYTANSFILQLPGQPGLKPLEFAKTMSIKINPDTYMLQAASFDCGSVNFGLVSWCLGRMFGEVFYNFLFLMIYNVFIGLFGAMINQLIMLFLVVPLSGMATIFQKGLNLISAPGVSPIIGLAQMGTYYVNFSAQLWMQLIQETIIGFMVPVFGFVVVPFILMTAPLLIAWVGVMVSIGMSTAYYVPMLPYILFTLGSIAWIMVVIEAMVAAPIVALGVTHPEGGHDVFGKGEAALMILLNVFLRPSMMIIGYITAISLSYVSVWILNAGFDQAIGFIQGSADFGTAAAPKHQVASSYLNSASHTSIDPVGNLVGGIVDHGVGCLTGGQTGNCNTNVAGQGGYVGWAGIYAFFFSIVVYTTLYLTVVQKSFTLIASLPDKVLRWIGGSPESSGSEAAQWAQEGQQTMAKAGDATEKGHAEMEKQMGAAVNQALMKAKDAMGSDSSAALGGK